MSNPSVTVIIPSVRNHEELDIVIKGLSNQTYNGPCKIVVVGPTNDPGKEVCKENNISGTNGHRSVGGYRASIYNALPIDSINLLIKCMKEFESNYN